MLLSPFLLASGLDLELGGSRGNRVIKEYLIILSDGRKYRQMFLMDYLDLRGYLSFYFSTWLKILIRFYIFKMNIHVFKNQIVLKRYIKF